MILYYDGNKQRPFKVGNCDWRAVVAEDGSITPQPSEDIARSMAGVPGYHIKESAPVAKKTVESPAVEKSVAKKGGKAVSPKKPAAKKYAAKKK